MIGDPLVQLTVTDVPIVQATKKADPVARELQ